MKTAVTIALTFSIIGFAQAHPAHPANGGRNAKSSPPIGILEKFDLDQDGKLSDEERRALKTSRRERMLKRFDVDRDGKLSKVERLEMQGKIKLRRAKLLRQFDADDDGKLSATERQVAREAAALRRSERPFAR